MDADVLGSHHSQLLVHVLHLQVDKRVEAARHFRKRQFHESLRGSLFHMLHHQYHLLDPRPDKWGRRCITGSAPVDHRPVTTSLLAQSDDAQVVLALLQPGQAQSALRGQPVLGEESDAALVESGFTG